MQDHSTSTNTNSYQNLFACYPTIAQLTLTAIKPCLHVTQPTLTLMPSFPTTSNYSVITNIMFPCSTVGEVPADWPEEDLLWLFIHTRLLQILQCCIRVFLKNHTHKPMRKLWTQRLVCTIIPEQVFWVANQRHKKQNCTFSPQVMPLWRSFHFIWTIIITSI